jgi:hypothetical protein
MAKQIKSTKKCHECFVYLPSNATVCDSCKTKVGPADERGIAKKPTDWKSYLIAVLGIVAFGVFLWWILFKDKM